MNPFNVIYGNRPTSFSHLFLAPKSIFFSLLMLVAVSACSAQNSLAQNVFWSKVRFGGGIGLGISNGGFNTSISPSAIYQFNNQFASGISATFNYAKLGDSRRYAYGGSLLSLYNPLPYLQLSAELEQLRINQSISINGVDFKEDYWSPALFFGAGYGNRNVTVGIRYNVLFDDDRSIYLNAWMPFFRVYF